MARRPSVPSRTMDQLEKLSPGMPIPFGGDRVTYVTDELAAAFRAGDALIVLQDDGDLLHVPEQESRAADAAVGRAAAAFERMGDVTEEQIDDFYHRFADRLGDDDTFAPIAEANATDVDRARGRGRSTTRLVLSDPMRTGMIEGLRAWAAAPSGRGRVAGTVEHDGWRVEEVVDRLGVVGFVFEGRPNVFADATGVLRGGNTVVFRIGSDALGTARAIVEHALRPALDAAGLPDGSVVLVDSPAHAAGWALFADPRLALAVARGSGEAVRQLGAVARQAGNPVSLHGTGGAWIVAASSSDRYAFAAAVRNSLDRKVCNTLNTCCIVEDRAGELVPAFLEALVAAGEARGASPKLHVETATGSHVPDAWFDREVPIARAAGEVIEAQAEHIDRDDLGHEWEWEDSPEVSLVVVDSVDEAVSLFNAHSPRFVASLVSEDEGEHRRFFAAVDAPYVGNGFTRWVDGQYALGKPELGLSNWENGRLFGRSGVLSGDSVFTIRLRVIQDDPDVSR
jgi:glutamate-5-semialdehyde dehydrogenase